MLKDKQNEKWLSTLNDTILMHLSDVHLSSTYLAEQMGLSQRQFYRKVKEITNTTPNNYLNEIRLQKAMLYLQHGEYKTLIATANAIGFKDPNYFAQKFKERFGVSPLEV